MVKSTFDLKTEEDEEMGGNGERVRRKEWGRGKERERGRRKEWGWGRQYVSISKVGCNTCNDTVIQHET